MIALRLYRMLPREHRLRLLYLVPPQRRLWLVRRLTRTPGRRSPAAVGSRLRLTGTHGTLRATVVTEASPTAVWRRNLDTVVALLESGGIEYSCLRPANDLTSAVAVGDRDRDRVLRLLGSAPQLAGAVIRTGRVVNGLFRPAQRQVTVVQVFFPLTDPTATLVIADDVACEVEFWADLPGTEEEAPALLAPRRNGVGAVFPAAPSACRVTARALSEFHGSADALKQYRVTAADDGYRSREEFATTPVETIEFPIDAVYTWVDGADPDWTKRKNAALQRTGQGQINPIAANDSRYTSRDELRYSFRSLATFAPWLRRIFLVTDDQVPAWLDPEHPRITVVSHRQIFDDTSVLPTFNSHAIESRLHRIPGLAEHFVYFNDDMFLGRPVRPTTFFHANGIAKFFRSPAQLDPGPVTVFDAPVTAAGKNNRRHIAERFGRTITQKMQHVPYPLQRSVLAEIERELRDEVRQTAAHQFRHPGDLSIPSSLQHYWAYLTRRSVPGRIAYTYADLAHPSTPVKLARLLRRRNFDVFCLNDTDSAEVPLAEQVEMLRDFLPRYFPFRSPFELPEGASAERAAVTPTQLGRAVLGGGEVLRPRQAPPGLAAARPEPHS